MGKRDVQISELIISMATIAPLDDQRTQTSQIKWRVRETPSGEKYFQKQLRHIQLFAVMK